MRNVLTTAYARVPSSLMRLRKSHYRNKEAASLAKQGLERNWAIEKAVSPVLRPSTHSIGQSWTNLMDRMRRCQTWLHKDGGRKYSWNRMTLGWSSTIRRNSTLAGREGHNRPWQSWSIQGANPVWLQYTDRKLVMKTEAWAGAHSDGSPLCQKLRVISFHFVSTGIEDKIWGRKVIPPYVFQEDNSGGAEVWLGDKRNTGVENSYCNSSGSE